MAFKLFKLKKVRSCYGCRALAERSNSTPPSCWLGEKIKEEGDWTKIGNGNGNPVPEKGMCYKPLTNTDMICIREIFYQ